jgi:GNAT superfamily N-acetyltransferase
MKIQIKKLKDSFLASMVQGFDDSNWTKKPFSLFEKYLKEQKEGKRIVFVAFADGSFAGYVTLVWQSNYKQFSLNRIPEMKDFNVLPTFRRKGVGSLLLDKAEETAFTKSNIIGIGVGLYADYGSAQRLYVKRGYIPNGLGITYNNENVTPGKQYLIDDDLVLWFTREKNQSS